MDPGYILKGGAPCMCRMLRSVVRWGAWCLGCETINSRFITIVLICLCLDRVEGGGEGCGLCVLCLLFVIIIWRRVSWTSGLCRGDKTNIRGGLQYRSLSMDLLGWGPFRLVRGSTRFGFRPYCPRQRTNLLKTITTIAWSVRTLSHVPGQEIVKIGLGLFGARVVTMLI